MDTPNNNVTPIHQENTETIASDPGPESVPLRKDLSRVSLFLSILCLILLAIVFFAVNRNMAGLTGEISGEGDLAQQAAELRETVTALDAELSEMANTLTLYGNRNAMLRSDMEEELSRIDGVDQQLSGLSVQLSAMGAMLADLEQRIAVLDDLPQEAKRIIQAAMLEDLAGRVEALAGTADQEQQAKLMEALSLIQDARQDLQR
ncbi:MAG: hypothetical protein D6E12_06965 [Desulfovibrio sp.]|nr:MAG: hypothetical protein D6E12_06965 [Desulfovibrio sp.]